MTSKSEADDDPKNWFYPIFKVAVLFFEGTPESGQGVKMSEILSFSHIKKTNLCISTAHKVKSKKLIFWEFLNPKIHLFRDFFFLSWVINFSLAEIKTWDYFRHFDTLTTFWGALKKMYCNIENGVKSVFRIIIGLSFRRHKKP